jgi:hypothetical protein
MHPGDLPSVADAVPDRADELFSSVNTVNKPPECSTPAP